jgi:16S rRNA (uracil1498-N3)-methyltransferase
MRTTRIHHPGKLAAGGFVELGAAASTHLLRVLRLKAGASVIVFNGRGGEFEAVIVDDSDHRRVRLRIGTWRDPVTESPLRITLAQGISRGERMDYTLQKSVELGVHRIIALTTAFSQVRLDGARLERRIEHWRGVILSACEQSGRTHVPELQAGMTLAQWRDDATGGADPAALRLVLDRGG